MGRKTATGVLANCKQKRSKDRARSTHPDKRHTASIIPGGVRETLTYVTMDKLLGYLSLGGPLTNMTNTPGAFTFTLDYSPNQLTTAPPAADEVLPTFLDALRNKTGLEVERYMAPMKMLIVDHADKIPAAN